MAFSLQETQRRSLEVMLKEQFKLLILDSKGQIISPLLKLGQLRESGVTLHLMLHSNRERIPGVAAVYFVENSVENLKRIAADCNGKLYYAVLGYFIDSASTDDLKYLATNIAEEDPSVGPVTTAGPVTAPVVPTRDTTNGCVVRMLLNFTNTVT